MAPAVVAVEPVVREGSQPILPPRPTGRTIKAQREPRQLWRSWPIIVIGLAAIAIVTATVIMIMPPGTKNKAQQLSPTPAPERMDTSPLPDKQSQVDPWQAPGAAPDPIPGPMPPGTPQPQAPDPDDDLWGQLGAGQGGVGGGSMLAGGFMVTVLEHACTKLTSCPDADKTMVKTMCDQLSVFPKTPTPNGCQAAQRCLDAIDHMSCSQAGGTGNAMAIVTNFQDCMTALKC